MKVDQAKLQQACTLILEAIGENPKREGLLETPRRFAGFWNEFMDYNPGNCDTVFEPFSTDQLVVVSGLRVWSMCEHHLLPFYADVTIGYLTGDKILGLSKFGRIAQQFAHRLQVQERLVSQIADEVKRLTKTPNVAVVAAGEHLCMTMRGVKMPSKFTSSAMLGSFRELPELRHEFMTLAKL